MSLINQVLQDLEQRGAQPAQEPRFRSHAIEGGNVAGEIRPVAVTRRPGRRLAIGWLLMLGVILAVAIFLWTSRMQVSDLVADARQRIDALLTGSEDELLSVSGSAPPQQDVPAKVNAALMVPVFQLSGELASVPAPSTPEATGAHNTAPAVFEKPATVRVAAASQAKELADKPSSPARKQQSVEAPRKKPSEPRPVTTPAAAVQNTAAPVSAEPGLPRITKSTANDAPEEIVIPADPVAQPIEKQDRKLTAYEHAENTFRQGVASLRKGQMAEAESRFRDALSQDRSHVAARQALIGILINSGRLADARAVLADSLDANPRQPGLAMLLARLQVDGGELGAALQTLERTAPYAAEDADYRAFMAAVLQRAGRHDDAVRQYRDALTLTPGNAVWMMGMGISLRALGQNSLAKEVFESAAATHTLNPDLQTFVEQQQHELAHALN